MKLEKLANIYGGYEYMDYVIYKDVLDLYWAATISERKLGPYEDAQELEEDIQLIKNCQQ